MPFVLAPLDAGTTPFVVVPLAITPSGYHANSSLDEGYQLY